MSDFNEFDKSYSQPKMEVGEVISHAFENYKKYFAYGIVCIVGVYILSFVIQAITGFSSAAMIETIKSASASGERISIFNMPGYNLYMGSSWFLQVLISPLTVGLIYLSHKANHNSPINFQDLFIGFKQNTLNIILYSIFSHIALFIGACFCGIGILFVAPLVFLGYPILLFENISAVDAFKKAFNLATENYWYVFGAAILGYILSFAGVILCGIGIVLSYYFYTAVMYSTYCSICGTPREIK